VFENKKILITGGTGSLGNALTKKLLQEKVSTIRIFSRDEWKQTQMESEINDERLRFLIGDIRDKDRLTRALEDIDIVIHAAALKHVPVAEYNPFEAVKTNVKGAQNVIEASIDNKVDTVLAISTDKAVSPLNTYGATKLLMERMFVSKNHSNQNHKITTMCVRYGNVLGSRGSVVPIFLNKIANGDKITITDSSMTRFNITMNQALDLVLRSLEQKINGSILVPKLKSYKLGDLVDAIGDLVDKKLEFESIKPRQGEKFHEVLINNHEIPNSYELDDDYVIYDKNNRFLNHNDFSNFEPSTLIDEYSSDKVPLLTKNEIKSILENEKLIP
jgi:UDP-N-acetylglucosamine 4,6-dehydratase/5-epimerase